MRWVARTVACVLAVCSAEALGHGGGGYRGPPGPPPPGVSEPWSGGWCPPPPHYGEGPVVARVLGADGAPLADARVWCGPRGVAATGEEGRFRVSPLRWPAALLITAAGHAPRIVHALVAPAPGAHLDLGDIRLAPGADVTGTVEGDPADRAPIWLRIVPEGTRVPEEFAVAGNVNGWNGLHVTAGQRFAFRCLPPGAYRVVACRTAGPVAALARQVRPGGPALTLRAEDVPPRVEPTAVPPGAVLTLLDVDGRSAVVVDRERGVQIAQGRDADRIVANVPEGATLDVALADDDGLLPPLEGLRAGQEVRLPARVPREAVEGRVVRADGSPVVHASVEVSAACDVEGGLVRRDRTDAAGRFRVDGVWGRLRIDASTPGLSNEERPCLVVAGAAGITVLVEERRVPGD